MSSSSPKRRMALVGALVTALSATCFTAYANGPAQPRARRFPVVVAAGDISQAALAHQVDTANLVTALSPDRVLVLGDNQYENGSLSDYRAYYDPTWGAFKNITLPTPGNHEYNTAGAAGYFSYFGSAAKPLGTSYYSTNIGTWHVVSLDANIERGKGSAQLAWLKQDLKASTSSCTLAFWHQPRFSSGDAHGSDPSVRRFWKVLYKHNAEIVLNGHEHNYERFARQSPKQVKIRTGLREFVVGTGGREFYGFGTPELNSQVRITNQYGVLRLKLRTSSYKWKFKTTSGSTLDHGRSRCN